MEVSFDLTKICQNGRKVLHISKKCFEGDTLSYGRTVPLPYLLLKHINISRYTF